MTNHSPMIRTVCVYCGSRPGRNERYEICARQFGESLAQSNIKLVYGGGTRGIMGAIAKASLSAGGIVTGIIPTFLMNKEATETELAQLSELIVTNDMHERKQKMFERADAFVIFPGGIGTLEEVFEIMTWAQLGRHEKPIIFANIDGFWNKLFDCLAHMRDEGFVHAGDRVQPTIVENVETIMAEIAKYSG